MNWIKVFDEDEVGDERDKDFHVSSYYWKLVIEFESLMVVEGSKMLEVVEVLRKLGE
ncbi:hypothetical protein TREMEDRAFT_69926 [Tremella mesenterica DSM 1558]|uniref:uncharacterized protein n=1 Tax=Tremella mesenterica (strain ATCC 24925 / CBS 8224 / DSM 1558 / NBRC 9311 / NRRL Y-6157 / RJB 2259-6 / UBC 559-6) TaxID=578456 RepID=UPI0003F4933E|nr:uncharacterized protein TREMEDRAFT_69926 [Tremella mesenterica DSM 1558]EIW66974.1 hypothetical protein TREMEDRAFT_69926 [Tremella mesenterica DSM 1558]